MELVGDSEPVEKVLLLAAKRIKQVCRSVGNERKVKITPELLTDLAEYLISEEWLETAKDLRLAIEDGDAWEWLKIPSMLKIQIKQVLWPARQDKLAVKELPDPPPGVSGCATVSAPAGAEESGWSKEWDPDHQSYYYYNTKTEETSWDPPAELEDPPAAGVLHPAGPPPPLPPPAACLARGTPQQRKANSSMFEGLDDEGTGHIEDLGTLADDSMITPSEEKVRKLVEMGFGEVAARRALVETHNSLEAAVPRLMQT
mmetsp:Transcript_43422/g.67855  ORF Transcript_43422/g.67855 Transcript_43422/m.67855 type:complete len:258 (+) Transcript_43422:86-859(+)